MRKLTKGLIIGSMAATSLISASMMMNNDSARRNVVRNSKKAKRTAEDLLNM